MDERQANGPLFGAGLRAVAALEITKGAFVLAIILAAISNRLPPVVSVFLAEIPVAELSWLGAAAAFYVLVRFVEAYGLWHRRRWAEWFAAISWALYLPIEISGLINEATRLKGALLVFNLGVVLFLTWTLRARPSTRFLRR